LKLKVGVDGWKVASMAFLVVLLITLLQKWRIVDFSSEIANILVMFAAVFLFVELTREKSKRKLGTYELIGLLLAGVVFLTSVLAIVGVNLAFMAPFEGFVLAVLFVFVLIELFKK